MSPLPRRRARPHLTGCGRSTWKGACAQEGDQVLVAKPSGSRDFRRAVRAVSVGRGRLGGSSSRWRSLCWAWSLTAASETGVRKANTQSASRFLKVYLLAVTCIKSSFKRGSFFFSSFPTCLLGHNESQKCSLWLHYPKRVMCIHLLGIRRVFCFGLVFD